MNNYIFVSAPRLTESLNKSIKNFILSSWRQQQLNRTAAPEQNHEL